MDEFVLVCIPDYPFPCGLLYTESSVNQLKCDLKQVMDKIRSCALSKNKDSLVRKNT